MISVNSSSSGNVTASTQVTTYCRIDNTRPGISLSKISGDYYEEIKVTINSFDATSGIKQVLYCLSSDGSTKPLQDYSGEISLDKNGSYYLRAVVVDRAGNSNETNCLYHLFLSPFSGLSQLTMERLSRLPVDEQIIIANQNYISLRSFCLG